MRFYKTRQFYMLTKLNNHLNHKKEQLYPKAPILKRLIPQFLDKYKELVLLASGKRKILYNTTEEKKQAKAGLLDAVLKLAGVLRACHSSEDGKDMPVEARLKKWALEKLSVADLIKHSEKVIAEAKEIPGLTDYGISIGDVKEAEAYLEEFTAMKAAPANAKKEIAELNAGTDSAIAALILFLENKIDPLIPIATEGNADLRNGYFNLRKVLPRGRGAIQAIEAKYRTSRKKAKVKAKSKSVAKKAGK